MYIVHCKHFHWCKIYVVGGVCLTASINMAVHCGLYLCSLVYSLGEIFDSPSYDWLKVGRWCLQQHTSLIRYVGEDLGVSLPLWIVHNKTDYADYNTRAVLVYRIWAIYIGRNHPTCVFLMVAAVNGKYIGYVSTGYVESCIAAVNCTSPGRVVMNVFVVCVMLTYRIPPKMNFHE